MRTTKHFNNLLVAILIGAVNLCAAYSIKEPGTYTASFSKSSSSASAFSQSSSSSYTINGNVAPGDMESLKEVVKTGAVAHASAGAEAGSVVGAVAGATASAGAIASASAGSIADGNDHIIVDSSGHEQGVTANAASNAESGKCSGGTSCGKDKDFNSISDYSSASDSGPYKVIGSDKYATGYSSGGNTNYAVSGQYVQPTQNIITPGGCISCKGPFPGPSGSIHTYKPAVSNSFSVPAPTVQPIAPASGSIDYHQQALIISKLPGPSGSIYQSKPVSGYSGQSAAEAQTQYNSGSAHVSPELVATLPGPSGSIYDSKPVSAVAVAGAYVNTGAASHSQVIQPSTVPSCSGSNCNSNPSLSDIISVLPGPSGSIHDSKPISGLISTSHQTSESSSNSYSTSGTVSHIPTSSVVTPDCSYTPGSGSAKCGENSDSQANSGFVANSHPIFPGPSGSIHSYKPVLSGNSASSSGNRIGIASSESSSVSSLNAYSGAGSITYNPYTHPTSDASKQTSGSTIITNTPSESTTGVYNGAGSVTNIPASHPVVGPVCNYSPGSPNKCATSGSSITHTETGSSANSEYEAGSAVVTPSIHPQLPSPGTYYVNKPTSDIEPPQVNSPHSFAGQIPCGDNSCRNIQKELSQSHPGNCGSAGGCGGVAAGSQSSAISAITYESKHTNSQYSSASHDAAHISGGVVFQNEDGSYSNLPKGTHPVYKNSDKGGYAVSSNANDNIGVLIGPGTGHLPIEADHKPFGTQGAFGGSEAFNKKTNTDKMNSFSSSSAIAHSSEHTTTSNTGLGTDVTIEKVEGTLVTPVDTIFNQSPCLVDGSCSNVAGSGSEIKTGTGYTNVVTDIGTGHINVPSSTLNNGNGYNNVGILTSRPTIETGYSNTGTTVISGLETETGYNNVPTSAVVSNTINSNDATSTLGSVTGSGYNHLPTSSSGSITGSGYNTAGISSSGSVTGSSNTNVGTSGYNSYNNVPESSSGSNVGLNTEKVEHGHKQSGTPIKLNCEGPFCKSGSTQVYIVEERPQYSHKHHGGHSGYATGQVLINQGQNILDITNSASHGFGSNYAGSYGQSYFPPIRGYSSDCRSGKCGAFGGYGGSYHKPASGYSTAAGGGFGIPAPGRFLEGLFGKGGLSGSGFNGGENQAAAYSSSGAYGGASAGSYASANAGASASAAAYAGSY